MSRLLLIFLLISGAVGTGAYINTRQSTPPDSTIGPEAASLAESSERAALSEDAHVVEEAPIEPTSQSTIDEVRSPAQIRSVVNTPTPLTSENPTHTSGDLSPSGILAYTNAARARAGLPALTANSLLSKAAQEKVTDMFALQYFAHESPRGEDMEDIIVRTGYRYLSIGENLALGNYKSDKELVEAWMDSPGHRENILNPLYTEIGISVVRGTYQGRTTYLAAQEFGKPQAACPSIPEDLSGRIDTKKATLDQYSEEIGTLRAELTRLSASGPESAYRDTLLRHNSLVSTHNVLLTETRILIEQYNSAVARYNSCISS